MFLLNVHNLIILKLFLDMEYIVQNITICIVIDVHMNTIPCIFYYIRNFIKNHFYFCIKFRIGDHILKILKSFTHMEHAHKSINFCIKLSIGDHILIVVKSHTHMVCILNSINLCINKCDHIILVFNKEIYN